jgi:hypothetical protein
VEALNGREQWRNNSQAVSSSKHLTLFLFKLVTGTAEYSIPL